MTEATTEDRAHVWLEHYPVTFFAVLMGLFGLALAFHAAVPSYLWAEPFALGMLWIALAAFVLIATIYVLKALRHPGAVAAEWHHPVKLAFFPTISISLLLMATALAGPYPGIAAPIWVAGMLGQGVLTIAVISGWISHRSFQVGHLTPAWFIPAVGNVIVPVAGVQLGWVEVSWLFFSAGMIFWVVLLTLVFNRLIFHDPMPGRLFPTMVILIAPPAVAFAGYLQLERRGRHLRADAGQHGLCLHGAGAGATAQAPRAALRAVVVGAELPARGPLHRVLRLRARDREPVARGDRPDRPRRAGRGGGGAVRAHDPRRDAGRDLPAGVSAPQGMRRAT
jgi:hypothetical protein